MRVRCKSFSSGWFYYAKETFEHLKKYSGTSDAEVKIEYNDRMLLFLTIMF
jgi:hypothetical protein